MAAGAQVYLAEVRPRRLWARIGTSALAAAWKPPDRLEHCVMFLDLRSGDRVFKHVQRVTALKVQTSQPLYCLSYSINVLVKTPDLHNTAFFR